MLLSGLGCSSVGLGAPQCAGVLPERKAYSLTGRNIYSLLPDNLVSV